MSEAFAAAAAELGVLVDDGDATAALRELCAVTVDLFGAAAASIAVLDDNELVYVAASGAGADEITGVRLPLTAGIAGFVASTGQALVVADVSRDPRFARAVAESTRYVPRSLLVTPVGGERLVGVLSVLDRATSAADDLERADRIASVAAAVLARPRRLAGAGRALLRAAGVDESLLPALAPDAGDDGEDELAALLAVAVSAVRAMPSNRRAAAAEAVRAVLALAQAGRAR